MRQSWDRDSTYAAQLVGNLDLEGTRLKPAPEWTRLEHFVREVVEHGSENCSSNSVELRKLRTCPYLGFTLALRVRGQETLKP